MSTHAVPLGDRVDCDWCGENWTERPESGGLLFGSKAACPDCAARLEQNAWANGEERHIRGRCPEGTSFADWVRGLRGPDAAVTIVEASDVTSLLRDLFGGGS